MITKEKFCQYVNYIQFLLELVGEDRAHKHINAIINNIQNSFPKDEEGFCEVEHYCFDLNFGKPSQECEYKSPENLYDELTKQLKTT